MAEDVRSAPDVRGVVAARLARALVLLGFASLGVRAGVLGSGLANLADAPVDVPFQPYLWMSLHLAGTVAAAVFVCARHRTGIALSAAFVIYSTVSLVLDGISTTGRVVLVLVAVGFLAGLVAVWLADGERPAPRRAAIELGTFIVLAPAAFALY